MSQLTLTALPPEILLHISDYLDPKDLKTFPFLNKLFWEISKLFSKEHVCRYRKLIKFNKINNIKLASYLIQYQEKNPFYEKLALSLLKYDDSLFRSEFNKDVTNLISQTTALRKLEISYNDPTQFNGLISRTYTHLKKLHLKGCLWGEVKTWTLFSHLTELTLEGTTHRNFLPLSSLTVFTSLEKLSLQFLHLDCSKSHFQFMTKLRSLRLANLTIKAPSPLALPPSLTILTLNNSEPLETIDYFSETFKLTSLSQLVEMRLVNFNPIQGLSCLPTYLKKLSFQIKPETVNPLIKKLVRFTQLTHLESLSLKGKFLDSNVSEIKAFAQEYLFLTQLIIEKDRPCACPISQGKL